MVRPQLHGIFVRGGATKKSNGHLTPYFLSSRTFSHMCGAGSFLGYFSVAWPTAEFPSMAKEVHVKLGYRQELQAIEDPRERLIGAGYKPARFHSFYSMLHFQR